VEIVKDSIDLGIVVRDLEACRRFYGEVLGLPFESEMPLGPGRSMFRYKAGTTVLKLLSGGETPPSGPVGMNAQTGLRYFTITVKDIEGVVGELTAKGCQFAVPLREFRPGAKIAILPDPDGNMVELLEIS
jgi:catechol 2,3-dioxygenase-like lactoylglutathione lyase family enzyme